MNENPQKLLPCPLCGGEARFYLASDSESYWYWPGIECVECGLELQGEHDDTDYYELTDVPQKELDQLTQKWNRRVTQ